MPYQYTIGPESIHVQYLGKVDAFDVTSQLGMPDFNDALAKLRKVIFDYTKASEVHFTEDDVIQFARLGRLMGSANEKVYVALIPLSEDRRKNAEAYRDAVQSESWDVTICTDFEEAQSVLANK